MQTNNRILTSPFEFPFKKKAFDMLQKALLASGTRIVLMEPDWNADPEEWTEGQKILLDQLCEIGNLYYELVPKL